MAKIVFLPDLLAQDHSSVIGSNVRVTGWVRFINAADRIAEIEDSDCTLLVDLRIADMQGLEVGKLFQFIGEVVRIDVLDEVSSHPHPCCLSVVPNPAPATGVHCVVCSPSNPMPAAIPRCAWPTGGQGYYLQVCGRAGPWDVQAGRGGEGQVLVDCCMYISHSIRHPQHALVFVVRIMHPLTAQSHRERGVFEGTRQSQDQWGQIAPLMDDKLTQGQSGLNPPVCNLCSHITSMFIPAQ